MDTYVSTPYSLHTSAGPYPQPLQSTPRPPILLKIQFNIIPHLCLGLKDPPTKTIYTNHDKSLQRSLEH